MPSLIRTSKESARGGVCAAQMQGGISTAETISAAAKAMNLYRLVILFVLPLRRSPTGLQDPNRKFQSSQRDRKSTRLNSSHLVISYAVFCLKKKKKKEQLNLSTAV